MRILLPRPRGFCAGVEMAIGALERALERYGAPLWAYHQTVHNKHVVASFERRGVRFVDDVAQVPMESTVVFSAHGVAPSVRAEAAARRLRVIDTTCPLVTKVHSEAKRFAQKGFTVVLIGHRGHDETVGVMGEVDDRIALVETVDDVDRLVVEDPENVALLTQTTLSVTDTTEVVGRLRARFPRIRVPLKQDICYATENRQRAVIAAASEADLVLVVGSRNSSNSNRLVGEALRVGTPAHLIDGPEEIDEGWLSGVSTLVLTAGASVPERLVQSVASWIGERYTVVVEERTTVEEDVTFRLPVLVR
jgi:4-hydroxy-3-methylbut-2-enyl diphosphate reductase